MDEDSIEDNVMKKKRLHFIKSCFSKRLDDNVTIHL